MRWWQLPAIGLIFFALSLLSLNSLAPELANKQFVFWIIGGLIFIVSSLIRIESWQRYSWLIYLSWLLSLVLILLLPSIRGAHRWLVIGAVQVQPSQFALPILGLLMTQLKPANKWKTFVQVNKELLILAAPIALIFAEPDLGTSLVIGLSLAASLWLLGTKNRFFLQALGVGVVAAGLGWMFLLQPYQKQRLTSFLEPDQASPAATYNTQQAIVSVGSGGWLGRGLGLGTQSQLQFLPESKTDFVFAALAEETGFIGASFLLLLYGYLIFRLLKLLPAISISYQPVLTLFICWLSIQTSVHVGMNLGLLPVTGLTLPLISYGGSSLISTLWWLGLIQSLLIHQFNQSRLHLG